MKYVIDLSKDLDDMIMKGDIFNVAFAYKLAACVKKGIALPEKHGRLVDENEIAYVKLEDSTGMLSWSPGSEMSCTIKARTVLAAAEGVDENLVIVEPEENAYDFVYHKFFSRG